MKDLKDKVAVITGAGSGIGRALSIELAHHGVRLALSDVDADGLAETALQISRIGAQVRPDPLDVRDRVACFAYAETVAEHFDAVNLVVNSAGITFLGEIESMNFTDLERVMDIDYWGVVNGTKAFLPHLIASGEGHIVNMSSVSGFMAGAGLSAYNSAKFAVRGFTEALRIEMLMNKRPVGVTCVQPGGVKTRLVSNGLADGYDQAAAAHFFGKYLSPTTPEKAAKRIVSGIRWNKPRMLIGIDAWSLDLALRLTGTRYQRLYAIGGRYVMPKIASTGER